MYAKDDTCVQDEILFLRIESIDDKRDELICINYF